MKRLKQLGGIWLHTVKVITKSPLVRAAALKLKLSESANSIFNIS